MAQEQNYQVNYDIRVNASEGTKQVMAFGEAVGKLVQAKASLAPAITNIKNMMDEIDRVFRTKNGKKRSFDYRLTVDTKDSEAKLIRVKNLLTEIGTLAHGIQLTINPGHVLDTKNIKKSVSSAYTQKAVEQRRAEIERNANQSVTAMVDAQKRITFSIGKINAALVSLERGRSLNIKTDVAEQRIHSVLGLLNQLKGASTFTLNVQGLAGRNTPIASPGIVPSGVMVRYMPDVPVPFAPQPFMMQDKDRQDLMSRLFKQQQLHRERLSEAQETQESQRQHQQAMLDDRWKDTERRREAREAEWMRRQSHAENTKKADEAKREAKAKQKEAEREQKRLAREQQRHNERSAAQSVRMMQRQMETTNSLYQGKRRAAINRLQYSKAPSLRNLPFISMLNAYMGYTMIRSELQKAVEYANIMQSAHSILRVADSDLKTFETRFDSMARHVRQIGVDTKFTAVEIAGAVKYLSMAGMDIETIHKSIRPIANLALIGDNDISQIADLATNIMAGYDIRNESMDSVADVISSTISRSNVNIIEVAESFKMAAGYLRMAGVEFTESTAAIGLLGNMGLKGTLAGTSLRAMATRFAKPTKEGQRILDRLGVRFTEKRNIQGVEVEKLRSIADIFEDLNQKGASMSDMQAIFGKIGGNAAMMFVRNYEQLRTLTAHNRASQGISTELAFVKQNTSKGLWAQVTSQLTETFMRSYEVLEPAIRGVLRDFLSKFKSAEFRQGLVSVGGALLDILSTLGSLASWVTKNFSWIQPLLFTGYVATKLFKISGALTNIGIAIGFIGKKALAVEGVGMIPAILGIGTKGSLSFANKRSIVTAMRAAGVVGKGAMAQAFLAGGGLLGAKGVLQSMFATQVATGGGIVGAAASLSAIGSGAIAATAGISGLIGALGWVAYRTWQIKRAKDAVLEEIDSNRKYRYPSIEALHTSLSDTYNMALKTKRAVEDVVQGKTIEEGSGHTIGALTSSWWSAVFSNPGDGMSMYTVADARQDDIRAALETLAKRDSQLRINSAYAEFGKLSTVLDVDAFIKTISQRFGQQESDLDTSLWRKVGDKIVYNANIGELPEGKAAQTYHYAKYMNEETVPEIMRAATVYRNAISSMSAAQQFMKEGGFDFAQLASWGFKIGKDGHWFQEPVGKNATDEERVENVAHQKLAHNVLVKFFSSLRQTMGGSADAAENILRVAGFLPAHYSNEPDSNDNRPFDTNPITSPNGLDDGGAGGNYSGTGRLSSAAPKQVIVNIDSLMSVSTIDLMKSEEGQVAEIKNLKEKLAEALIDVVHDFDASWNS